MKLSACKDGCIRPAMCIKAWPRGEIPYHISAAGTSVQSWCMYDLRSPG